MSGSETYHESHTDTRPFGERMAAASEEFFTLRDKRAGPGEA